MKIFDNNSTSLPEINLANVMGSLFVLALAKKGVDFLNGNTVKYSDIELSKRIKSANVRLKRYRNRVKVYLKHIDIFEKNMNVFTVNYAGFLQDKHSDNDDRLFLAKHDLQDLIKMKLE